MAGKGDSASFCEKQDRMTWLQQLVDQMSLDERLAVTAMISKRNDPLAVLPKELILEILGHLPIFAAWRLQLVCRRWRSLLSSEKLLRVCLLRWETHSSSDSAKDQLQAVDQSVRTKVRHMQAMMLGRPFSRSHIRCDFPSEGWPSEQVIALKGSRLAYLSASATHGHSVVVKELVTGNAITLRGDARETIHSLALSSDAVAFVTHSGKLYARDLTGPDCQTRSVRLPSAAVLAMHLDEKTVGLVLNVGSTVALLDLDTGSLRSFQVDFGKKPDDSNSNTARGVSLLLTCRNKTVDIFRHTETVHRASDVDSHPSHLWRHARYSFAGQQTTTSYVQALRQLQTPIVWTLEHTRPEFCRPYPSGYDRIYNIGNALIWPDHEAKSDTDDEAASDTDGETASHVQEGLPYKIRFDAKAAKLRRDCIENMEPLRDTENNINNEVEMTTWKEVLFGTERSDGLDRLLTRNLVETSPQFRIAAYNMTGTVVAVNDTFLVSMQLVPADRTRTSPGLYVQCFDETLNCQGFYNTRIWNVETERAGTEKHSDPDGHLMPYNNVKE